MTSDQFNKFSAPLQRALRMMIGLVRVRLVDDAKGLQRLQVDGLADETLPAAERFQDYGFTSRPLPGAEGLWLSVGGVRGEGVVIAVGDRRYRLKGLAEGEVAMFDDLGQVVHLTRAGISIETELKVTVTAPKVVLISDNVSLGGEGGAKVARVGDAVSGGVITGGSSKVTAL